MKKKKGRIKEGSKERREGEKERAREGEKEGRGREERPREKVERRERREHRLFLSSMHNLDRIHQHCRVNFTYWKGH